MILDLHNYFILQHNFGRNPIKFESLFKAINKYFYVFQ